jgi:HSP20 family protein
MADNGLIQKNHPDGAPAETARSLTHTPRVDVMETDEELLLFADLPGTKPGDVDIRFENGELALHGRRNPEKHGRLWQREYEPGNFYRVFRLTEAIAADKIHAELKNGVLTVHLPKAEAVKPRKIAVKGI